MGRSKSKKFEDNNARRNVIQAGKELFENIRGHWKDLFFENENGIVLELACGRGEYTVGLARIFPEKNFIGIDIKGSRIWSGSTKAVDENLQNVAFLRIHIQNLDQYFDENEVSEIWIIHPDPRPRNSDQHRRLTHPRFLEIYKKILKPGGVVRLKTDNTDLFGYSLEVLQSRTDINDLEYTHNLYESSLNEENHGIKTRYEEEFTAEGHSIKYLKYSFK